jgi:hypothetical protein
MNIPEFCIGNSSAIRFLRNKHFTAQKLAAAKAAFTAAAV